MNDNCPCGNPLPLRHRKYCELCSSKASTLWKRQQRQAYRDAAAPVPYWLDHWLKPTGDLAAAREAYNTYMRAYMRARRARLRTINNGVEISIGSP